MAWNAYAIVSTVFCFYYLGVKKLFHRDLRVNKQQKYGPLLSAEGDGNAKC
jgi:hypothetical protein